MPVYGKSDDWYLAPGHSIGLVGVLILEKAARELKTAHCCYEPSTSVLDLR